MKMKTVGSFFAIVVLSIAAISFIWIPSMGTFGGVKTLGSWDGNAITNEPSSPFYTKLQYVQRMFETFGGSVPNTPEEQQFFNYQLSNTAMSASIIDLAMETEAAKNGYAPTDKLINMNMIKQFTDPETGLYSQEAYAKTQEADKLKLRTQVIENIKRSRYIQDVFGSGDYYGVKTGTKEAKFVAGMNSEKRTVQYVSFRSTIFPTDKVKAYAEEHSDLFVKYDLSVVSFQDEKAASNVSKEILKGNVTFEDAIKNQNASVTNSYVDAEGKLINSYRKDLNALFPNAEDLSKVINLKAGEVSTPVKMNSLYVVLKCNSDPVQPDFTNSSLIDQASYYMRQYEKGIIEDYLVARANDFIKAANEKGFQQASIEFLVQPAKTDRFTINYGNSRFLTSLPSSDSFLSSISRNEDFFREIFALKQGEFSKPFLINENAIVAMLDEITPADEISDAAVSSYKNQNRSWSEYYTLSLLTRQFPLSIAQETVIDYILQNPKAKNNLYKFEN